MPTVAELMKALPGEEEVEGALSRERQEENPLSMRPVPVGRWRRVGLLASLQSKIAAAYLFYWVRKWFKDADERERLLAETHWRTAVRVLDSMSYLRGMTIKVGQMLGNFPTLVPAEVVEALAELHFNAPPMHWSLLREMVFNELGDEAEKVFASFEKRAFAAASLGQVHRARLKSGQDVAVKIQYPGIARAIAEDFRNFGVFMMPARLSADWENMREQFDDLRMRLEQETDYVREARMLEKSRSLFRESDGIVVPRVYPEYSSGRVLTMDRLKGVHLDEFLASDPPQEVRNEFARKILRSWYRMLYAARMIYVDFNPGNFLFMEDGRLGLIDFGCMLELDDGLWEMFRKMERPLTTGEPELRRAISKEWSWIGDSADEQERLRLMDEFLEWSWQARVSRGEFDFGDEAMFGRGVDLFVEMCRRRYTRGRACSPIIMRQQLAMFALLFRLKAKIDIAPIAEEEVKASGWDRSDYAPSQP